MSLVINVLLFQASWFACVLGAASGLPWIGVFAASIVVTWHLARATRPRQELALVIVAIVFGALFETLLVQLGWIRFEAGTLLEGTAPYWMVALWAAFATTLNVSLRWLRPHWRSAALLGAIGGPGAYYAGAQLGALEFAAAVPALAAISIGWAILTPLLLGTAQRLDGYAST
jgi:Protein of unknown function (DUF2878)